MICNPLASPAGGIRGFAPATLVLVRTNLKKNSNTTLRGITEKEGQTSRKDTERKSGSYMERSEIQGTDLQVGIEVDSFTPSSRHKPHIIRRDNMCWR